jgi:hypothetical protein
MAKVTLGMGFLPGFRGRGGNIDLSSRATRSFSFGSTVNSFRCRRSCRAHWVISLRTSRGSAGRACWRLGLCAAGLACRSTLAAWI